MRLGSTIMKLLSSSALAAVFAAVPLSATFDASGAFQIAISAAHAQVDPTDPTDPTGPTDPTDPTGPTDPTDPTDPNGPIGPIVPFDPTDPTGPTGPTDSVDPPANEPTLPINVSNSSSSSDRDDPQPKPKAALAELSPEELVKQVTEFAKTLRCSGCRITVSSTGRLTVITDNGYKLVLSGVTISYFQTSYDEAGFTEIHWADKRTRAIAEEEFREEVLHYGPGY